MRPRPSGHCTCSRIEATEIGELTPIIIDNPEASNADDALEDDLNGGLDTPPIHPASLQMSRPTSASQVSSIGVPSGEKERTQRSIIWNHSKDT